MLVLRKIRANRTRLVQRISTSGRLGSEDLFVHRDSPENNVRVPFEFTEANMVKGGMAVTAYADADWGRNEIDRKSYSGYVFKRIAALVQNYPHGAQRSVVGAALDIVQRQMGWIPISAMHKVAQILDIPRIRVYEWATFYTMCKRNFRGKFHVKVCVTTPCMIRGSDTILRAVEEATCCVAGSLSIDGMFGVDTVQCAGACVNAPVLVVDDDYYEDVTVCDVENIIQTLRCGGIPPPGPQSGRYCCEPACGLTSLLEPPPCPGYGIQHALLPHA